MGYNQEEAGKDDGLIIVRGTTRKELRFTLKLKCTCTLMGVFFFLCVCVFVCVFTCNYIKKKGGRREAHCLICLR